MCLFEINSKEGLKIPLNPLESTEKSDTEMSARSECMSE